MTQLKSANSRISDYVVCHSEKLPDQAAVIFGKQCLTYAELNRQVQACSKALLALGIQKGDRVATLCTPRTGYWVVFLATTSIGAIWLGVNPKYSLDECRYVIGDAQPKLLFSMAAFEGRNYQPYWQALSTEFECLEQVVVLDNIELPENAIEGAQSYSDFLTSGNTIGDDQYQTAIDAVETMDPALLVYTSGSTGKPKGALLSHYGLCFGATVQNTHYKVDQPSMICNFPINHVACVADTCCVILVAGGTIHFQERFDPEQVLQCIHEEGINMLAGVPTMLLMVLDHPRFSETDFSPIELIIWGGAALPEASIRRLQTLGARMISVYGMTETAANTIFSRDDASLEQLRDSIGYPSPTMPCRIVNSKGELCQPNEQGELQFKGEYLLLAYLNRSEATQDVYTQDGWLHTGDVGYWRDDGAITLVGRLTEMFKSGGYNVYPREIELLIESHPSVEMAAVIGVPDPLYQEVGAAFVQLKVGENLNPEDIKAYCKTKLANYKVPKHIEINESLPRLPVGKVDKVTLKTAFTMAHKEPA